ARVAVREARLQFAGVLGSIVAFGVVHRVPWAFTEVSLSRSANSAASSMTAPGIPTRRNIALSPLMWCGSAPAEPILLLGRCCPVPGLVILRQTFVGRCHRRSAPGCAIA